MEWYAKFLAKFPWIPILIIWVICLASGPVVFYFHLEDISNFTDYTKGLEPRGTEIHTWTASVTKLEALEYSLSPHRQIVTSDGSALPDVDIPQGKRRRRDVIDQDGPPIVDQVKQYQISHGEFYEEGPLKQRKKFNELINVDSHYHKRVRRQDVVPLEDCLESLIGNMGKDNIKRIVVETSTPGGDLLSPENLHAICKLEEEFITPHAAVYRSNGCPAHSLPTYIAALNGVTCDLITEEHVNNFRQLIADCKPYYEGFQLNEGCTVRSCPNVPRKCYTYQAMYKTFHYLADKKFQVSSQEVVKALLILPQEDDVGDDPMTNYFLNHLNRANLDNGVVKVTGMELGVKYELFQEYLIGDLPYFGLAGGFILLILLVYLRSVVLLLVTLLNVAISFSFSYFLYFYVYQLKFYPFMNIFAGLILIAVGADDIFVLKDIWDRVKYDSKDPEIPIHEIVQKTLRHGALSIFVTSLTTAAAFIANFINQITAIRLFGVFAATCILVNFVFMITWVLGVMVITEIVERKFPILQCGCLAPIYKASRKLNDKFYQTYLPRVITKVAPVWVVIFTVIGTAGTIMVFATPTLKLPTSSEFQILQSDHPFERYSFEHKLDFRFESVILDVVDRIYLDMVWGIEGEDNGDWLDPESTGTLTFDKDFDFFDPASLIWLRDLCRDLMKTDLVGEPDRYLCFLDAVETAAAGGCDRVKLLEDTLKIKVNTKCCETAFPGSRELNQDCIVNLLTENLIFYTLSEEFYETDSRVVGLTLFDQNNTVKAFKYIFRTNMEFTNEYTPMKEFYQKAAKFMGDKLAQAPKGMSGGWFTGAYEWVFVMLDLQEAVATGALLGIGVSVAVGFVVLVITSPNIILNIFAIISIELTIAITVGSLAAMGWELNIVESLTITLAVGLSIDFTIHYSVAYRISKALTRQERVKHATGTVGSAVSMGALTTFLAGASVMPGRLLVYTRFGIFLMVVMSSSWLFANFFFLSLCSFVGPQGNTGEILALCKKSKKTDDQGQTNGKVVSTYPEYSSYPRSNVRQPSQQKPKALKHALPQEEIAAFWSTLQWTNLPSTDTYSIDRRSTNGASLGRSRQSAYLSKYGPPDIPSHATTPRPNKKSATSSRVAGSSGGSLSDWSDNSLPYTQFNTGTGKKNRQAKLRKRPDHGIGSIARDPSFSFIYSRLGLPRFLHANSGPLWTVSNSITSSLPASEVNLVESLSSTHSDSVDPDNHEDFLMNDSSNETRSTELEGHVNPASDVNTYAEIESTPNISSVEADIH